MIDHGAADAMTIAREETESAGRAIAAPILELRGVSKSFGGVAAVRDVDLSVGAGEVVGLVGENGAGKSTLMNIVSGVHSADSFSGAVLLDGASARFKSVRDAEAAGVVLVPQELHVAPGLSVAENMFMGRLPGRFGMVDDRALRRQTLERLSFFGIRAEPDAPAATLSPSEQRLVTIAAALAKAARLLILDEPTAALTEAEAEVMFAHLASIRAHGVGCLYISHRLDEIEKVADRVVVMRNGQVVERLSSPRGARAAIVRAMIGRDPERAPRREAATRNEPTLSIDGFTVYDPAIRSKRKVDSISLTLHRGEILGLFGLVGAGRTELARAVFGAWPGETTGGLTINGHKGPPKSPGQAIDWGLGMLTEDRKRTGLIEGQPVLSNISAASLDKVSGRILIDRGREYLRNQSLATKLDVRPPKLDAPVQAFSGGNQQKILLARWLATEPRILILDEPTLGVDVGARFEIYRLIRKMAAEGQSILFISSDVNEVIDECDRILVMYKGRLNGEFDQGASRLDVMATATGTGRSA
jgi:ABC-type sugar transport system ATPase subunit